MGEDAVLNAANECLFCMEYGCPVGGGSDPAATA